MEKPHQPDELTLDPQDWTELRSLGHSMVDDMIDYLSSVAHRPVWQPPPAEVKQQLRTPAPTSPEGAASAYQDFRNNVLPYALGNIHPRFWAWVIGSGSGLGMLSEMLAATMNPNVGGGNHAAPLVEQQVLSWMKEALGFPQTASGLLVTGGSLANTLGMAVARHANAGFDVKTEGLFTAPSRLMFYGSSETHNSVVKGLQLLGLGKNSFCPIAVTSAYKINTDALREAVRHHRGKGIRPICVIGNAGTVNTGAVDDLSALADFCTAEKLWFHVDGAIGAPIAISPNLRPMLHGMERADSIAFDLHKWMHMPYDVGCILVRDEAQHRSTFSEPAGYLSHLPRGIASGDCWFSDYSPELSRGFRALKVWMCLKEHGLEKYGKLFEQNLAQAQYLGELVRAQSQLELLAPIELNIVCLRYVGNTQSEDHLTRLNQEILMRLHEQGIAAPSTAVLGGKFAIRVSIANHRSCRADFDLLVREVLRLGKQIEAE